MKIDLSLLRKDLRRLALLCPLALGIWALVYVLTGQICSLVLITGLPCPWCGMTRALTALLQADLVVSVQAHPLLLLYLGMTVPLFLWRYGSVPTTPVVILGGALLVLTLGVYLHRMLTLFPTVSPMTYFPRNLLAWIQTIINKGVSP